MGASGSKLHRSTGGDVKDNLMWAIEELQRWEDGAAMVKDLLATDISEPSEALAAVGVPIEKVGEVEEGAAEGAAQTAGGPPQPSTSGGVQFDASVTRHLLHSVDEVLRRGESQEYFKNVPQEKLEQMMSSSESSWFVLPPRVDGGSELSSSRIFALAAVAKVLDERTRKDRGGETTEGEEARLTRKRSQGELYESRTPYSSPAPATAEETERLRQRAEQPQQAAWLGQSEPQTRGVEERQTTQEAPSSHVQRGDEPYESSGSGQPVHREGATLTSGREESKEQPTIAPEATAAAAPHVPSPSLRTVDNHRKVVVAKYLFIHHLFSVLVSSAEFCVKSAMRVSTIKKLMRPGSKAWETLPPIKKLRYQNLASDSHARLDRALVAFDRARLALTWLLRNYELSLATYKVNATIASLKHIQHRLQQLAVEHSPLAASIRSSQLSEVNLQLQWFDRRRLQLLLEMQSNERDSLNIGLYMLDRNLTGTLTSNEMPTLPVKLFQLLDVRKKNEINASDMQQCVYNLCKSLDAHQTRLHQLLGENARMGSALNESNEVIFERNKMEIAKIRTQMDEEKEGLSSIYSVFHASLVDHLFAAQSSSLSRVDVSEVSMSTLHAQLEEVEHRAAINLIESELHLGMRGIDIVGLAGGSRAKEMPSTAQPPSAAPTPKEALLGRIRGESPERERKTAHYEQPMTAGWKKEEHEVSEEKIPAKDASALEGGGVIRSAPTAAGKVLAASGALPVHTESQGVPHTSTTDEQSVTERIKYAVTGSSGAGETMPMGGAEESQAGEYGGGATMASAPHEESSIGDKIKSALGIGQ